MAAARDNIVLVNITKEYSRELLLDFFNKLLKPNFGMFEDELDDLDTWIDVMENPRDYSYVLHIILAFDKSDRQRKNLLGGVACEYYPDSSVGLLTYFAVAADQRKHGVGRVLVDAAHKAMQRQALQSGRGRLRSFLLETNSAEKVAKEKDVMDPSVRTKVIQRLGFEPLALDYTQPALQEDKPKCNNLLLCVHKRYLEPEGAPAAPIAEWIAEFFKVLMGKRKSSRDVDNLRLKGVLGSLPHVPLLSNASVEQVKKLAADFAKKRAEQDAASAAQAKAAAEAEAAAAAKRAEEAAAAKRAEDAARRAKAEADAKAKAAADAEAKAQADAAAKAKADADAAAKAKADADAKAKADAAAAAAKSAPPAAAPAGADAAPAVLTRELVTKLAPESVSTSQKVSFLRADKKQTAWKRFNLSEEDAAEAYYRFQRADGDGSGSLSKDEIIKILKIVMAGQMKDNLLERLGGSYFDAADRDKSGAVSVDEFYQIFSEIKKACKPQKK